MRLFVPDPRDALSVLERCAELSGQLLDVVPRSLALLDEVEQLMTRVHQLVDGIESTRTSADEVVRRTDAVVGRAEDLLVRTSPLVERLEAMTNRAEPSLIKLQPTLDRLAETTDPREVEALVGMVNLLPTLLRQLEDDVLPVLSTMGSVAPDLRSLMELAQDVDDMIASIPGVKRLARRRDDG